MVAALGTDHHDFRRCLSWLDSWAAEHPEVSVFAQHGHSAAPRHATGVAMTSRAELLEHFASASVVLTHGGTGSIMDARACGHLPVVVPRRGELGEHVDDHQVSFSRRIAERGWIHLAEHEDTLHGHLDRALAEPVHYRLDVTTVAAPVPAVSTMDDVLAGVLRERPGRLDSRRLGQMARLMLFGRRPGARNGDRNP
ncbi:glycosyl transferase [Amycolatopsis antarctica]|uniref:Glycosyl transferase n=1 Tax=Amycolatopsis antarctica TaxID=1854586 RepID=A0A263CW31_9PSEU|nr:glycosyl transferase [Amycolatopsis antarctica]